MQVKSYMVRDSIFKYGKQSKDLMTVFVAANMTGSNKLPLLIIGKSEKPRKMYFIIITIRPPG